jgi:hypothetical protein
MIQALESVGTDVAIRINAASLFGITNRILPRRFRISYRSIRSLMRRRRGRMRSALGFARRSWGDRTPEIFNASARVLRP